MNYQFHDRVTGKTVLLDQIDEEVCKLTGKEVNKENFSFAYQTLTMAGIAILLDQGGDSVTPEAFETWANTPGKEYRLEMYDFYKLFLVDRYKFSAWR